MISWILSVEDILQICSFQKQQIEDNNKFFVNVWIYLIKE